LQPGGQPLLKLRCHQRLPLEARCRQLGIAPVVRSRKYKRVMEALREQVAKRLRRKRL
jgi:hypothetical protein